MMNLCFDIGRLVLFTKCLSEFSLLMRCVNCAKWWSNFKGSKIVK